MKKAIILTTILLLALLAYSFEINEGSSSLTQEIKNTIQEDVTNPPLKDKLIRKQKIKRIKAMLRNPLGASIVTIEDGEQKTKFYCDPNYLSKELKKYNLQTFLENDKAALAEVSDYFISRLNGHGPVNDFEVLVTLGVEPIEAAIRTNHDDYIQSALDNGTISYISYEGHMNRKNPPCTTIEVITDEAEIYALKEKLSERKNSAAKHEAV